MIAYYGRSKKEVLHGYTEPCVNDAMDIAMTLIRDRYRGPNSPIILEKEIYFSAMSTIQSRTEEFFAQYDSENEELRLSSPVDSDQPIKQDAGPKAERQEQVPQVSTGCRYFPRKHHITGKRIGWIKSRIIWQHEAHLEKERARIYATAPQALLKGRTKEEIKVHVYSVLNDLYLAAKIAAVESEPFAWDLNQCYTWVNEKIYLRQGQWMSLISRHLDYLVEKLKAETQIEEEKEKFLQKFNSEWEDALKRFTGNEAYEWVRYHSETAEEGMGKYIKLAQEEVDKLLESARVHFEYVKLSHEEDEAACQWEFELNALFEKLKVRAQNFLAEQEDMVQKKMNKEIERVVKETRMQLFRSLRDEGDFGALSEQ